MKDSRVTYYRKTLEGLLESLDATVRLKRWTGEESVPEPLKESASRLITRLGTVDRLASSQFKGNAADVARVNALVGAMRRLDTAYVAFCQESERGPREREKAAEVLGSAIDATRAEAQL
jgi:hypothetical protein